MNIYMKFKYTIYWSKGQYIVKEIKCSCNKDDNYKYLHIFLIISHYIDIQFAFHSSLETQIYF